MESRSTNLPAVGPNSTDTELIQAIQAGQSEALTLLYRRYSRLVYSIAMRILGNTQEAEDLTQEIFVTFWQKTTFDANRGSLSSFLGLLTRSRAFDRRRSRGAYYNLLERYQRSTPSVSSAIPFDQVFTAERQEVVKQALLELPPAQRQVLEMAYYEGLSQTEIAQRIEVPLGTVKTRSRQGLLKLRRLLGHLLG